eukprot:scaffold961_cov122-Cylindrotheca_fusiformis.AAC.40
MKPAFNSVCGRIHHRSVTTRTNHEVDCGFCRLGLGLGISHWHCHSCCLCLSLELVDPEQHSKICNMDTTHADCPICFEPLHDSRDPVVMGYYCGHYLHKSCCDAYFQKSWKVACPICQKPLIQMKDEKKSVKRTLSFKLLIMLVVFPLAGIGIVKMQTTTQFSSLSSQKYLRIPEDVDGSSKLNAHKPLPAICNSDLFQSIVTIESDQSTLHATDRNLNGSQPKSEYPIAQYM